MNEWRRLGEELGFTLDGDAWHGPSLREALEGVDAKAAAARPIPGAHTIWELVLHVTAWTRETTRRVRGGPSGNPAEGDWPEVTSTDRAAWEAALAGLRQAHEELQRTLLEIAETDLDRQIGGSQTDSAGRPVTFHRTVVGLLQHDTYHAGQIVLLKKLP